MAPIILELKALNERFPRDDFLGKGTLALSEIFFTSPSRCAVADRCWISVDRRLTKGENAHIAIGQIEDLPAVKAAGAEVTMYSYERSSYTGLVYPADAYFPTWWIGQDHPVCSTLAEAFRGLFNEEPVLDKWTFSTNGVSIMGRYGIPCIGFGPGHEDQSHAPNEKTWKKELVHSAAMYAVIPQLYVRKYADRMPRR
jgi:putative selenium metabolism hydrolase